MGKKWQTQCLCGVDVIWQVGLIKAQKGCDPPLLTFALELSGFQPSKSKSWGGFFKSSNNDIVNNPSPAKTNKK